MPGGEPLGDEQPVGSPVPSGPGRRGGLRSLTLVLLRPPGRPAEAEVEAAGMQSDCLRRPTQAGPAPAPGGQAVAPVLARADTGRAGEDGAAGVVDVLVGGVGGESLLEPDELRSRTGRRDGSGPRAGPRPGILIS